MKPKKLLFIIPGLLILAGLAYTILNLLPHIAAQNLAATPTVMPTPIVAEMAVRARGKVEPAESAGLAFNSGGLISEWTVKEGDTVQAGDVLGRLDTRKLEFTLQEAQLELETARLRLAQAEKDLAQRQAEAELSLQVAEARLAQARMRSPSLVAASVRLQNAREAEANAQDEYNKSLDRAWETEDERRYYRKSLENAVNDRKIAEAEYAAARNEQSASTQEVTVLDHEVARAQLNIAQLAQGVDPTLAQDIARAELRVAQVQADLAAAKLVAPFAGTVVESHYRAGDWADPGFLAVVLADLTTLRIETTDLDEWSMTRIRVGDLARISFTAFDDKIIEGRVAEIALKGEALSAGDVMYRAIIVLDEPDPDLRWGMTVRVTIPLDDAQ